MRRGEIYIADMDPTVGRELRKRRPVLIVSNDTNNEAHDFITVIPLTSNVSKVQSFEVWLPQAHTGLPKDSKALPQQIRTISKERITGGCVGIVKREFMPDVDAALRTHLGLK